MTPTIYIIGVLLFPILIMIICWFFPDFEKEVFADDDIIDLLPVIALIALLWPLVFIFGVIVGFYYSCYWLINYGKHKE